MSLCTLRASLWMRLEPLRQPPQRTHSSIDQLQDISLTHLPLSKHTWVEKNMPLESFQYLVQKREHAEWTIYFLLIPQLISLFPRTVGDYGAAPSLGHRRSLQPQSVNDDPARERCRVMKSWTGANLQSSAWSHRISNHIIHIAIITIWPHLMSHDLTISHLISFSTQVTSLSQRGP